MCMALTASNVKYVSNHLKRVGHLKDILLCTPKKSLLVISVEESFLQKTIWGCIWKQNMNMNLTYLTIFTDVDFLRKKSEFHLLFQEDFLQGSRRVQCDVCFENFRDRYNLKRHYVVHTREKPYACSLCDGRFTQISSLKQHVKTKHDQSYGVPLPMVEHKWTQIQSLFFRTISFKLQDATNVKSVSKAFETNMCLKGIMLFTRKKNPTFVKYVIDVILSKTNWKFISEQYTRIRTPTLGPTPNSNLILSRQ